MLLTASPSQARIHFKISGWKVTNSHVKKARKISVCEAGDVLATRGPRAVWLLCLWPDRTWNRILFLLMWGWLSMSSFSDLQRVQIHMLWEFFNIWKELFLSYWHCSCLCLLEGGMLLKKLPCENPGMVIFCFGFLWQSAKPLND